MIGSMTYWHRRTEERVRAFHWLGEDINEPGMRSREYGGVQELRVNDGKEPGNWLRDRYVYACKGDWVIWWVGISPVRVTVERDYNLRTDFTANDPHDKPYIPPTPKPTPAPERSLYPTERKREIPVALLRAIGKRHEIAMEYLIDYAFIELKGEYPDNPYWRMPIRTRKYEFSPMSTEPLNERGACVSNFNVIEYTFEMKEQYFLDEERETYLVGIDRQSHGVGWRQLR